MATCWPVCALPEDLGISSSTRARSDWRGVLCWPAWEEGQPSRHPKISQEVLAEMVGTTRPRINEFMNKFRKLGFIEYNGGLHIHSSLLNVLLHG